MQALGFIEVVGKVAAIEAADTCLKSANVNLIGCELTRGALITVKVEGDVGAVKSAIDAAKSRVMVQGKLVATLVIPRPAKGISSMLQSKVTEQVVIKAEIEKDEDTSENEEQFLESDRPNSEDTVKLSKVIDNEVLTTEKDKDNNDEEIEDVQEMSTVMNINTIKDTKITTESKNSSENSDGNDVLIEEKPKSEDKKDISCNLCHDPVCSRKRGQPKNLCIHYKDKIEDIEGDVSYEVK